MVEQLETGGKNVPRLFHDDLLTLKKDAASRFKTETRVREGRGTLLARERLKNGKGFAQIRKVFRRRFLSRESKDIETMIPSPFGFFKVEKEKLAPNSAQFDEASSGFMSA